MRIHPMFKLLFLGIAVGIMAMGQARADELYGKIRGTVTDSSGAAIPAARVTVRNSATGVIRSMEKLATGDFEFVDLQAPGVYDLDVEKQGFRKFHVGDISLNLNQIYVANAALELGSATQVVTVEANAAQINTTEMHLGATVTGSTIVDMPLVDRNWIELQQLQAGVVGGLGPIWKWIQWRSEDKLCHQRLRDAAELVLCEWRGYCRHFTECSRDYSQSGCDRGIPFGDEYVACVGNQARHLEGNFELNPAGQANGLNPVAAAAGCTPVNLATCAPQTFTTYNPNILGAIDRKATDFNSRYNSLQVSVNKRFTHGLSFLAAYTWSRFFDQNSSADLQDSFVGPGINPFNFASMWAPSDNDAPQLFVFSYNYTLPLYHYVKRLRPAVDGWKLAGITAFQSGFPVQLFNSADPSLTCNAPAEADEVPCWERPNRTSTPVATGNPRTYNLAGGPNYWFNPAAFASAAPRTGIGSASRAPLYGPGLNDFDLSLEKEIHFTESKYIQLRFETYNTFNHSQWFPGSYQATNNAGGVVSDINSPQFGPIITANPARIVQLAGKIYF